MARELLAHLVVGLGTIQGKITTRRVVGRGARWREIGSGRGKNLRARRVGDEVEGERRVRKKHIVGESGE